MTVGYDHFLSVQFDEVYLVLVICSFKKDKGKRKDHSTIFVITILKVLL